jgi:phage shock protein PspC (stress-responsive transcriptional regulator)
MATELRRPPRGHGRIIAGVCASLADRFHLPRTLVRLGFVVFAFVGAGELAYVVLWVLVPTGE